MKGIDDLIVAIKAGYSLFYFHTHEMSRAVTGLSKALDAYMENGGKGFIKEYKVWDFERSQNPEDVMNDLDGEPGTVVIAKNWNWFLRDEYGQPNKLFCSFLQNRVDSFTTMDNRKVLIVVGDEPMNKAIPNVLEKDFMALNFELPSEAEIKDVLDYIVESAKQNKKFKKPTAEETDMLIAAAKGLTMKEVGNAYSFSLVENSGVLSNKTVARIRARNVESTAGLKMADYDLNFDTLKGYSVLKEFTINTIKSPLARGVILLGPPGVGKTHFCRCLSNESGLPMFELEMAELFGGLVGESEALMRSALDIVRANTPCILFVDK